MSGVFTAVGETLENGMSIYVTSVSSAVSSAIVPVVTTAVTVWIIAYGFAAICGEAHESVPAFAWRGLNMAAILSFALGSGIYQSLVLTAVEGATAGLSQTIQSAAASAGAGNAGCGSVSGDSVTGTSAGNLPDTRLLRPADRSGGRCLWGEGDA
jgi:type IV secretion system protein VirB6